MAYSGFLSEMKAAILAHVVDVRRYVISLYANQNGSRESTSPSCGGGCWLAVPPCHPEYTADGFYGLAAAAETACRVSVLCPGRRHPPVRQVLLALGGAAGCGSYCEHTAWAGAGAGAAAVPRRQCVPGEGREDGGGRREGKQRSRRQ